MLRIFRLMMFLLLPIASAFGSGQPFDQAGFDRLQKEGKPILVVVHADWCPACAVQEPIVSELLKTPELQGIAALRIDFDKQQEVAKRFKAPMQSTLIVFKGGREVGRSVGDTRKQSIAALLRKTL